MMYYVGWLVCPHCTFRERVCVEAESPLPPDRIVEFCCPNDESRHRFSLAHMQATAECPPDLTPRPWACPEPRERPMPMPADTGGSPVGWHALILIWLCVAAGAIAVAAVLLHFKGVSLRWIGL
jgi:hypothetical protein